MELRTNKAAGLRASRRNPGTICGTHNDLGGRDGSGAPILPWYMTWGTTYLMRHPDEPLIYSIDRAGDRVKENS